MSRFSRLDGLSRVPDRLRGAVVAIGNFDGFHRGHQSVLEHVKALAAGRGVAAIALTFEPHPRDVFAPSPVMFRLTEGDAKAAIAEALGLDALAIMPFTQEFSQLEADDFVSRYLIEALGVSAVVVGSDFRFGRARRGTPDFLRAAGVERGFAVDVLDLLDEGDAAVSSSRVRAALSAADIDTANGLLGYHWFFSGEIVEGDHRGRELGYPTANMPVPERFELANGIYAVRVRLDGASYGGVASFGKPMFDTNRPPFETHLFDFEADIYGRRLTVCLVGHIRPQAEFAGMAELISAMAEDSRRARRLLEAATPLGELDRRLGFVR